MTARKTQNITIREFDRKLPMSEFRVPVSQLTFTEMSTMKRLLSMFNARDGLVSIGGPFEQGDRQAGSQLLPSA